MTLKLIFSEAKQWKYLVDTLSRLIDEASFIATPEGLRLRALDPSRIAMVDFVMPSEAFEEYLCDGEVRIGVNFDEFKKIMKRGSAKDKLELEVSEERRLKVRFRGRAVRTFSLPILELGAEELPTPRISFTVEAKLLSDAVKDAIKDAEIVSDYVKFETGEECLLMKASSDRGSVEVEFTRDSGSLIEIDIKEPSYAAYSLDYLSDMMKAYQLSDILTIEYATNKPLALTFDLPGGGRLTFYLAPRMEA
ncbi:MAG: proliferating cell nuclear antigen (pcna) [Thermoprotei archaeon]|nr:MAG: proliferating cell nuclear antigen (pcna) [Thermoprotei archaeon]